MLNKKTCLQRGKQRPHRPKQRKQGWPWMLTALVKLVIQARSDDVCGTQSNVHQWSSLLDVNFQMMHATANHIAIGATTTKADRFHQPDFKNMLAGDSSGALLSIYSSNVNDITKPLKSTLMSTIDNSITVNGFKNINMGEDHAYAVLDTSDDRSGRNIYLVTYYIDSTENKLMCSGIDPVTSVSLTPCYYRKQLQILKLGLNNPLVNIMLTSSDRVWLSGEYFDDYSDPGILTVVLDTDRYGTIEVDYSEHMWDFYNNYPVLNLKAVAPRDSDELLHVSTSTGLQCGTTLVTKLRDDASVKEANCFTLHTQNPSEVYEPIGVYNTGSSSSATVLFLEYATQKSFITAYIDNLKRNDDLVVQKYGFTTSSIRSITAQLRNDLLDMVIIHDNGYRDIYLVTGYDPEIPVMPNFFKVLYQAQTSSTDFVIHKRSNHIDYYPYDEDKLAWFGKDVLFKSDVTAATPTDDCILTTPQLKTSSVFDDQWSNSQESDIDGNYQYLRESQIDVFQDPSGWYLLSDFAVDVTSSTSHNENVCQIRVQSLFDTTTTPEFNLLNNVLPIEKAFDLSLSFDTCPNGSESSFTYADLQIKTITATYDIGGPLQEIVDETKLLTYSDSTGGSDYMQVTAQYEDFSTKLGLYTVGYKVGFVQEPLEELLLLPNKQVTVTLTSSCTMTLPTYSTSSTLLDTYTHVRGWPALVYTLSGYYADCDVTREFLIIDGNPLVSSKVTTTQSSTEDTLSYEDNEIIADVLDSDFTFRMASVKDPSLFQEISIPISLRVSSCTQLWNNPKISDASYLGGDPELVISFDQSDVNDCPFKLEITDVTDSSSLIAANPFIFTLTQPVLTSLPTSPLIKTVASYGTLKILTDHSDETVYGHYRLRLDIVSQRYPAETQKQSQEFSVTIVPCVCVSANSETTSTKVAYKLGDPQMTIAIVASLNTDCPHSTFSVVPSVASLGVSFSESFDSVNRLQEVYLQELDMAILQPGNYELQVIETDTRTGFAAKTKVPYEVTGFCTQFWTHQPLHDVQYISGDPASVISFNSVSVNDCPFKLEMVDVTDPVNEVSLKPELFTLTQPVLTDDPDDLGPLKSVIVQTYGSLRISMITLDESLIGNYTLRLDIISQRYPTETQKQSVEFTVFVKKCENVAFNSETLYPIETTYVLGAPSTELVSVNKTNPSCQNSYFELFQIPDLIASQTIEEDLTFGKYSVFIEQANSQLLPVGNYVLEVSEVDVNTGFRSKTTVSYSVEAPPNVFDPSEFFDLNETQADSDPTQEGAEGETESDQESSEDQEEAETADSEDGDSEDVSDENDDEGEDEGDDEIDDGDDFQEITEAEIEASVTIEANGKLVYPWQRVATNKKDPKKQQIVFEEEEIKPLRSYVKSVTPTGNMTIAFTKPIILPPLRVDSFEQATDAKNSSQNSRRLQGKPLYSIMQVLDIRVESSFYEEEDDEIELLYYNLTRLTQQDMDIQLTFKQPTKITQNAAEPDDLVVDFKRSSMFMDFVDREQLDSDLEIMFQIQPQISSGELAMLKNLCGNVANSVKSFSYIIMVPQAFFAMALKYLWNFMNLLQFLIFMLLWAISLPETAKIVIQELRSIALLEFIPTDFILKPIKLLLGLPVEDSKDSADSCVSQDTGIDRVGSTSLLDNMGAMFLIAAAIVFFLVLFFILRLVTKRCKCAQKLTQTIKKKLFYNTFLRFVLQSTLKLQISACTIIAYENMATHEVTDAPSTASKIQSWTILIILNLCPILFYSIVARNTGNLHKDEIQSKIGTLYSGLKAKHPSVKFQSFAFLVRRSLFVVITFVLFDYPGIQVQFMIYMTLLQIIYIGHQDFYETRGAKALEITNESIFVLIQYNFVLLHALVSDPQVRQTCGYVMIGLTGLLLFINMTVIIVVSIKAIAWKCHLKSLKKKKMKEHQENQAKKLLMSAIKSIPVEDKSLVKPKSAEKPPITEQNLVTKKKSNALQNISSSEESSSGSSNSSSSESEIEDIKGIPKNILIQTKTKKRSRRTNKRIIAKNTQKNAYRANFNTPIVLKSNPFYNKNDYINSNLLNPFYSRDVVSYEKSPVQQQVSSPPINMNTLTLDPQASAWPGNQNLIADETKPWRGPLHIMPEPVNAQHRDQQLAQTALQAPQQIQLAKKELYHGKSTNELIKQLEDFAKKYNPKYPDSHKHDLRFIGDGFFNQNI